MAEAIALNLAEAETIAVDATTEGVALDLTTPGAVALNSDEQAIALDLAEAEQISLTLTEPEPIELALTESVISLEVVGQVGPPGPAGPEGPAGPAGAHYRHVQSVPATAWVVEHGLGYYPVVATQDSAGTVVYGNVAYVDENTLTVSFSVPFGGYANLS